MYSTYFRNYDQRKHESDEERDVQHKNTRTSRDKNMTPQKKNTLHGVNR